MNEIKRLRFLANGVWHESETDKYMDIWNPSTGEKIAEAPYCTEREINMAIQSASDAFPAWSAIPALKRVQIFYRFRELLEKNMDELTHMVSREQGKIIKESYGEILKIRECVEFACGIPSLMMGESLMNTSTGYDTVFYREPLGVFAGIPPFNFPGMIPMGWMAPLCIATGNTIVIKASCITPMTSFRCAELWQEAGLPDGVMNIITCGNNEAELLLGHPDIRGISFVGSTAVGLNVYNVASSHGKRSQILCSAKNHGLVLEDAALERSARGIINSSFGCAGERCMALPVVVAQESIADRLVSLLKKYASELKIGPAYEKSSEMGPLVTESHRQLVLERIEKGIREGATLVLDGRKTTVEGYEKGFYLGPTIFDNVTPGMTAGDEELFGPVLSVKRVRDFEEGITIMNSNKYANGSIIFTQSGYHSREFAKRTNGGMVGINVGIPVPVAMFAFSGNKQSFFGDLHVLGKDGIRFYTRPKVVTTTWFDEEEKKNTDIDTWDGSIGR
jgi:malonate-semialdehyde dehydrogenase (acetylating)/methylmalonate-semialdehyde dehydrogenase